MSAGLSLAAAMSTAQHCAAGTKGAPLKGDDSMEEVLHVMDRDAILFFTQVSVFDVQFSL